MPVTCMNAANREGLCAPCQHFGEQVEPPDDHQRDGASLLGFACGYLTGAADHTEILSVGKEQTEVPYGHFKNVVFNRDNTPLHPKAAELSFYAKGVGGVLAIDISDGDSREVGEVHPRVTTGRHPATDRAGPGAIRARPRSARRQPPSCWRSAQSANRKPFPDRNFCPAMRPFRPVCSRGCGHRHMDRKYATFCVPMARECGSGRSVARGALAAPPRGATTPLLVIAESWPAGNCRPGAPKRRLGTGRVGNLRDRTTRVYVALRR